MKRRTFIKRTSIGLPALAAGLTGAGGLLRGGARKGRVYGVPDSVRPRAPLEHNLARLSLARTDLPVEAWQEVVALSHLAQDVFDRSEVAAAFTRDPRAYLEAIGMTDVRLDPAAVEVKVALALGDPEIRHAVASDDVKGFLEALERRDLLSRPEPAQLASIFSDRFESIRSAAEPGTNPEFCTVIAACIALVVIWVWVGVIQDAVVTVAAAVAVSIYAYALIYTYTTGPKKKPDEEAVGRLPGFRLAGALGGESFKGRAMRVFVDETVESIASAVEGLRIFKEHAPMSSDELRRLVRVQMLQQLSGHALSLPAARS